MNWEKTTIGEHCTVTSSKRFHLSERSTSGVPFYCSKEIIQKVNGHEIIECDYIREELYEQVKKQFGVPKTGDLLITTRGTYGVPYIYSATDRFYFADGNLTWLKDFDKKLLPEFLLYWVKSHEGQGKIDAIAKGTAQKAVPIISIKALEIPLPQITQQKRIIDILSAYDNLIENNQKQIKLLEEAAQRLHKEWFVDLRFPGYETTPVVDGVPEGWQKYHLKEVIDYEIGGGWGEELPTDRYDCAAYVIRGTDLFDITHGNALGIPFRYHSRSNLLARMLADGDIVFEVSGGSKTEGVARTALIRSSMLALWEKPAICASFCKLIRPVETRYSQFIFDTLQYMRFSGKTTEYDKRSASSIVNYRWKDFLSKETFVFPSDKVLKKYNLIAESTYQMMICKSISIEKAREARDRLLPKLMSGEIEV